MKETGDEATIKMAERMWEKLGNYWSEKDATNDRMNRLTYIVVVLDPRHKMEYPKYALQKRYGDARSLQLLQEVNTELQSLFEVYQTFYDARQQPIPTQSSTDSEILNMSEGAYTNDFESGYSMTEYVSSRTELELYLKADREPYDPKSKHMFDILGWWKTNSVKYPILSDIARDILAVPISTVPSESAFSTGGRVLDSFRSSLSPQIVEALICCGDWIRSSKPLQNDDEEDLTVLLDAQDELEDVLRSMVHTTTMDPPSTSVAGTSASNGDHVEVESEGNDYMEHDGSDYEEVEHGGNDVNGFSSEGDESFQSDSESE
ncbi:Putative AC transposase [Linum grandiflorum]